MSKALIIYGTTEGHTAKVAHALAEGLRADGIEVDIFDSREVSDDFSLEPYDQVIIGGSVHYFRFQRSLSRWVRQHREQLNLKQGAFFSVCLGILDKNPGAREGEETVVQKFFQTTGWYPVRFAIFAGALPYTKYGWVTKWIMKSIARRAGHDTDTSRDYEYTDWGQVRDFAKSFSRRLSA